MSAIFDGYEREYCELSTQLGRKTSMLGSLSGGKPYERTNGNGGGWVEVVERAGRSVNEEKQEIRELTNTCLFLM